MGTVIRLIGPGGAGKSTTGALLARRLGVAFIDLDASFTERYGNISAYIHRHGYEAHARENVAMYCGLQREPRDYVIALSSGFMTYSCDIHPEYAAVCRTVEESPTTFLLLPSFEYERCVAETLRRQMTRPFAQSAEKEEAKIRRRFPIYMAMHTRKIETARLVSAVVHEIISALPA